MNTGCTFDPNGPSKRIAAPMAAKSVGQASGQDIYPKYSSTMLPRHCAGPAGCPLWSVSKKGPPMFPRPLMRSFMMRAASTRWGSSPAAAGPATPRPAAVPTSQAATLRWSHRTVGIRIRVRRRRRTPCRWSKARTDRASGSAERRRARAPSSAWGSARPD